MIQAAATDVNAVAVNNTSRDVVVVADDRGLLRMYRFPVTAGPLRKNPADQLLGHNPGGSLQGLMACAQWRGGQSTVGSTTGRSMLDTSGTGSASTVAPNAGMASEPAEYLTFAGCSPHLTAAEFSASDSHLLTTSLKDGAIYQWKYVTQHPYGHPLSIACDSCKL